MKKQRCGEKRVVVSARQTSKPEPLRLKRWGCWLLCRGVQNLKIKTHERSRQSTGQFPRSAVREVVFFTKYIAGCPKMVIGGVSYAPAQRLAGSSPAPATKNPNPDTIKKRMWRRMLSRNCHASHMMNL